MSYGIFAHWFSLDQRFKFSVSFATEVEKKPDHRMDVLIEVFTPQKTQREQQTGTAEGEGLVGPRPHHFFAPPPPLFVLKRKIIKIKKKT